MLLIFSPRSTWKDVFCDGCKSHPTLVTPVVVGLIWDNRVQLGVVGTILRLIADYHGIGLLRRN